MNETKLWNTAIYHFTERNYHKAKDAFSEIPFTAEVEYNIAICLINLKCYEAAIESLKRALVYDPMLMVAYFQLAHCQSVIKETNGAIESLTNCLIVLYANAGFREAAISGL
jgi:tetratricopeptide (TPR) repeat protein